MDICMALCKHLAVSHQVFMSVLDGLNCGCFAVISEYWISALAKSQYHVCVWSKWETYILTMEGLFEDFSLKYTYSWGVLRSLLLPLALPPSRITFPIVTWHNLCWGWADPCQALCCWQAQRCGCGGECAHFPLAAQHQSGSTFGSAGCGRRELDVVLSRVWR